MHVALSLVVFAKSSPTYWQRVRSACDTARARGHTRFIQDPTKRASDNPSLSDSIRRTMKDVFDRFAFFHIIMGY
jgi:hypothetical protein